MDESPKPRTRPWKPPEEESPPVRVVIAEHETLASEEVVRAVRSLGFDVVGDVSTGRQAVALTAATGPDLVIMDLRMPELDGIEAARQIQEVQPTPVILLAEPETREVMARAGHAGVAAYLTKPPDPAQIERAAFIALGRFQDMQEIHRLNQELILRNWKLRQAMKRIRTLEGILPLCASCRRIPDEDGEWIPLEVYVSRHTGADFSHGYCPRCESRLLEEIDAMVVGVHPEPSSESPCP